MGTLRVIGFLVLAGLLLAACGIALPPSGAPPSTVEIEKWITAEVTRVVRQTAIVPVKVTEVVRETVVVPVEVTRVVREVVVVTSTTLPASTSISPGFQMQLARARFASVELDSGRYLLIGGSRGPDSHMSEVEFFDPSTGLTNLVTPLNVPRYDHTAVLLQDGRVLVTGGYSLPSQWLNDAEIYDPRNNVWTQYRPIYSHGTGHTATLLRDGRVLVVGGCVGNGVCTERAEIFTPQTNSWMEVTPLASDRALHASVLLEDGRVLVTGGRATVGPPAGGDALVYDPATNVWQPTGGMVRRRSQAQAVRLLDGRVLVAGGIADDEFTSQRTTTSAEIYDPATNAWRPAADLAAPRLGHRLVLLPQGRVLAVGGTREADCCWSEGSMVAEIEMYDPLANRWQTIGRLTRPIAFAGVHLMPDGRVWVAGGFSAPSSYWPISWMVDARADAIR